MSTPRSVEVHIVGRGVDTLVLNVCYADRQFQPQKKELSEDLQNRLNLLQNAARMNETPIPTQWAFKGINLFMQEKGSRGQWRWILKSPLLTVAISRGRLSRIIAQVRLSSEYLWSCEYLAEAIVEVGLFLYNVFGEYLWFQVSAVDLCADVVGWDISQANWQECFISRAIGDDGRPRDDSLLVDGPDVVRRRWKRIETLDFGKHTSPVSCCIYHKTAEIRQKSPAKVWFHDLWKRNGWDSNSEVWRVEFRLTREFLHAASIEAAEDLPDHIQALWEYCAGRSGGATDGLPDGWLRYVTPTKDTNRARWPVHPAWKVIQGAFLQEDDGTGANCASAQAGEKYRARLSLGDWLPLHPGGLGWWRPGYLLKLISPWCCAGSMEQVLITWKRKIGTSPSWCNISKSSMVLKSTCHKLVV